jgi:hypothetical protein
MSAAVHPADVSHDRARKESTMLILFTLAALYGGWRATRSALAALRRLPRSNDDLVFY